MSVIDRILRIQEEYEMRARENNEAVDESNRLDTEYGGGRDSRQARLAAIAQSFSARPTIKRGDHPDELDHRHNPRTTGGKETFTLVSGCSSCDHLKARFGLTELIAERQQIRDWIEELNRLYLRQQELYRQCKALVAEANREAERAGLPEFELTLKGEGDITSSGPVVDFTVRGRVLLDSGVMATYGSTTVVLDHSDQLVAYRTGDGDWNVMKAPAKPHIASNRGWYTVLREGGDVELMLDRNGEYTNGYPHVHVIHDAAREQIRVVASRSSTNHSPPEVLSGDASGNEVNAAIERAIRLL